MTEREQIQELIFTYCHLFDAGEFEKFAQLFEHGTLNFFGVPMVGRESVLEFLQTRIVLYQGRPRTQHLMNNTLIQIGQDQESATAQSYLTVLQKLQGAAPTVILGARYLDEFEREDGYWRFKSRTGTDGMIGDLSGHLRP